MPATSVGLCLVLLCLAGCARTRQEGLEPEVPRKAPRKAALVWPVEQSVRTVTSPFGMRLHPQTGQMRLHRGLDIAAPLRTPVYAAAAGVVTFSGRQRDYGNIIVLGHGDGMETAYAHLEERLVAVNHKVRQGQTIGRVGKTGNATGLHLHFEVRINGVPVDPMRYLP